MDMSDINLKALAAARMAAQKPSGIKPPHCWFCNKVEAWFQCDCQEARDAQQGRRAKPRFDAKRGTMVLDEEIILRNLAWGHGRRYEPPKAAGTPKSTVSVAPVSPGGDVDSGTVDSAAERRARRAAYERQRRAKLKPSET